MAVGILLTQQCHSQVINNLVFVVQGRNLNIVAEACSNDLNVFSRIILAAFSRKQINASCRFTHLQHHARHRAINYGGVFDFFRLSRFNEVTGALKEFIFTNFAPSASDVVGQYIDEFVHNSKK